MLCTAVRVHGRLQCSIRARRRFFYACHEKKKASGGNWSVSGGAYLCILRAAKLFLGESWMLRPDASRDVVDGH